MCRWKVDSVFKIVNRDGETLGRKKNMVLTNLKGIFFQTIIIHNYYTLHAYLCSVNLSRK